MNIVIKNSSGKSIGEVIYDKDKIIINNDIKPTLIITDTNLIQDILNKKDSGIICLYDQYTLTIGEIAQIYHTNYSAINKKIKQLPVNTHQKSGRRNSSYGKTFSKERIEHMVQNRKDDHKQLKGKPLSEEKKIQISQTLKQKYASGELTVNSEKIRQAWLNGSYENVDFGHGIGGHIYSYKNKKEMFFRSLLELKFYLLLEESGIPTYEYEPIRILCDNGTIYTPDFKVNNILFELKSKKYIEKMGGKILEEFCYKKQQAETYCKNNNLQYKVIFDEQLNYNSKSMKKWLKDNPEIIAKYKIKFIDPTRVFGHKK